MQKGQEGVENKQRGLEYLILWTGTPCWHSEAVVDDDTGGSCCEPPNVGYSTAAKVGNQEVHEPGTPKLSAWPIPHPGCVLTAVKEQEQ